MNTNFNVALIGCGGIAVNHLQAIGYLDNVKVVALCDIKPEKAQALNEKFGLNAKIYTDYIEMLNTEKLDAIHVATPHYLHAPMTIEALNRDVNVFLEKPMCMTRQEIADMLDAEKNSNARACVCFQNRYNPSTLMAKKVAEEDGGAISAYGCIFWERTKPYYTESGWRGTYATEGGGVLINQAIHTLDLVCQFLGKPKKLWATKANHHLKGVIEVEDSCEGLICFENGKRANFYATTSFEGRDATILYLVTEKKRRIQLQYSAVYVDGEKIEDPSLVSDFIGKECYGNGHMYMIENYYNALKNGKEMPVTLESAQYALRVLLASYKSNNEETNI